MNQVRRRGHFTATSGPMFLASRLAYDQQLHVEVTRDNAPWIDLLVSSPDGVRGVPASRTHRPLEGLLAALAGRLMHHPVCGLRRMALPRTPANRGFCWLPGTGRRGPGRSED